MAISVGNTHLQTSKIAKINYPKILEIQNITNLPLVLHGSSGISYIMRKKIAQTTKVAKFNIGTELRQEFGKNLRLILEKKKNEFDRNIFILFFVFIISRFFYYYFFNITFDSWTIDVYWQFIPKELLKNDLINSILFSRNS